MKAAKSYYTPISTNDNVDITDNIIQVTGKKITITKYIIKHIHAMGI